MKFIFKLLLVIFTLTSTQSFSQDGMGGGKKQKFHRHRKYKNSYNPYLEKKGKNKPSAKLARENKKDMRKKNKAIKKQKRQNRINTKHGKPAKRP